MRWKELQSDVTRGLDVNSGFQLPRVELVPCADAKENSFWKADF